ncbi:MAG TPA: hypothetical protein VGP92_00610 [Acidimicrobiia bacterium]|nr:hypothetical protein [Acidimicrobiia bacterium]
MTDPPSWQRPSDTVIDATWVVAHQLGYSLSEASEFLEARANGTGRPLDDVALDVIERFASPDATARRP